MVRGHTIRARTTVNPRKLARMVSFERVTLAYNNVYLVEEPATVVAIDTGPDYQGAREAVESALAGRVPELVVATHGHLDHAGLGSWWQAKNVPVLLSREDLHFANGSDFEFDPLASYVRTLGAPPEVEAGALDGLRVRGEWNRKLRTSKGWPERGDGRWPTALRYEPFAPLKFIDGSRDLPCGLKTLPMPGHTPGNLVVFSEQEGWLFSGDQLLPEIAPTPAIQFVRIESGAIRYPSLPRFLDSLASLQCLRITRCFPGHGEPFDGVQEAIADNLSQAEQRTQRVRQILRGSPPLPLYALGEALYPRALRRRFWQIIATVQGHLDVLEERGEAIRREGLWQVPRS